MLGGMVTATVLAIFVTPLFYTLITRVLPSRKETWTKDGQAKAPAVRGILAG